MNPRNIDRSKQARLQEDLTLLKAAVDSAQEAVLITDKEGAIRYANPAFEKTTGYHLVDIFDKNPRFLKSGHHDEGFYKKMWDTVQSGKTWEGVITNKTIEGKLIHEETTITPVRNSDTSEISHFVAIKRDITEKLEIQQRLEMTEKMASAGVLAAGVAHEVNNPLTLVLGFAQVLSDDERIPEDARSMLRKVYTAAQRAGKIVKNLLEFGRKQEPLKTRLSVKELFDRLEPLAGYDLKREGIQYSFEHPLERCLIHADLNQMEQVLLNLIINAKQAMEDSEKKELKVSCDCDREDGMVVISVEDTGPGISEEILKKIFEPFYTTKPVGEGTGLGLAICYGIAEDHGGTIKVESKLGKGTKFSVYIPAEKG